MKPLARGTPGMLALVLMVLLFLYACAGPKLVAGTTATKDQMKFLYVQGGGQGIIKCGVTADGKLSNCREIPVNLKD